MIADSAHISNTSYPVILLYCLYQLTGKTQTTYYCRTLCFEDALNRSFMGLKKYLLIMLVKIRLLVKLLYVMGDDTSAPPYHVDDLSSQIIYGYVGDLIF